MEGMEEVAVNEAVELSRGKIMENTCKQQGEIWTWTLKKLRASEEF